VSPATCQKTSVQTSCRGDLREQRHPLAVQVNLPVFIAVKIERGPNSNRAARLRPWDQFQLSSEIQ
jgi:hypothetical protein